MEEFQKPLDLSLWLNADVFRQQNFLKRQFIHLLEEVGNSFSPDEFDGITLNSRGAKISKGNDLLGFPYQVLDLIRDFNAFNGVNIRLLNWFGNGFFVTILLGKNRENPIDSFLELGFSFGISENQWDYPDLILNKNQTVDPKKIAAAELGFNHWIKSFEIGPDPKTNSDLLAGELKKILGILRLPSEKSRI